MTSELVLDPVLPVPVVSLIGAVLLALTAFVYLRIGTAVPRGRKVMLLLFRLSGLALVLLLLLQPSRREFLPPPTRDRVTLVAVDSSLSMKQRDAGNQTRMDAAKRILLDSEVAGPSGMAADPRVRLFEFAEDAQPLQQSALDLAPRGKSTRLNRSVTTLLNSAAAGEAINAIILLSDGHDFELINPVRTGASARMRQAPIYAIALGRQGNVRDVAARITSFQPYCYVKQKARITASLRFIGCEFEDIQVQLLRHGQIAQTRRVNAGEHQELAVHFEVEEPEVGQFEYEVRVQPLEAEVDNANNSAITYLNVIDQQIRVLLLEGDPYWDTTFLQRSLMRNDKFDVDSLIRYGPNRVRAIRKTEGAGELRMPETLDALSIYDVILLGCGVEELVSEEQASLLDAFARERSGTVIFTRGPAFGRAGMAGGLEPVLWSDPTEKRVRLDATSEGRGLAAFRTLQSGGSGMEALPDLLEGRKPAETQPLTSTLATAAGQDNETPAAAVVHRRYGRGQVVSIGVQGLWRWGLNARIDEPNSPFDRFWDQMILWLMAGRDFIPTRQFSFRPNSANILLGEKVHFRVTMRQPDPDVKTIPLTVYSGETEVGRLNMNPGHDPGRLNAEYLPERVGRYRVVAEFPDGSSQESRFIVFNENLEETEVATDALYLRRLCESSGGRLINADDLPKLLAELRSEKVDTTPKTLLRPVWNQAWVFYLAGVLFGLDWFLRRRWGLC